MQRVHIHITGLALITAKKQEPGWLVAFKCDDGHTCNLSWTGPSDGGVRPLYEAEKNIVLSLTGDTTDSQVTSPRSCKIFNLNGLYAHAGRLKARKPPNTPGYVILDLPQAALRGECNDGSERRRYRVMPLIVDVGRLPAYSVGPRADQAVFTFDYTKLTTTTTSGNLHDLPDLSANAGEWHFYIDNYCGSCGNDSQEHYNFIEDSLINGLRYETDREGDPKEVEWLLSASDLESSDPDKLSSLLELEFMSMNGGCDPVQTDPPLDPPF